LGRSETAHFLEVSKIEDQTSSVKSNRKCTAEGLRESSSSRKRTSRLVERPSGRQVRMRNQPEKLTPEMRTSTNLACFIASDDGFSLLAVDAIKKQESLVPPRQLLDRDDYEPSHRKYML
jgi:chromatin remodeling complex protein RSC6